MAQISHKLGGDDKIRKADEIVKRWGGPGVVRSRWLVPSLGPWLIITSGIA